MSITTVANCKAFRSIPAENQEHDDELERLISGVQAFLEQECQRSFEKATVTEYYNGGSVWSEWGTSAPSWRCKLMVDRPPIVSVTSIWDDPLRVYGSDTLIAASKYVVDDADAGLIVLDGMRFQGGLKNVKVTYVGGFETIPFDLEQAAIEMVWAAREKGTHMLIGVRSRSIADGNVQFMNLDWGSSNLTAIIQKYSLRTGVA